MDLLSLSFQDEFLIWQICYKIFYFSKYRMIYLHRITVQGKHPDHVSLLKPLGSSRGLTDHLQITLPTLFSCQNAESQRGKVNGVR